MTSRLPRSLWMLLTGALAVRLVLALATGGDPHDLASYRITEQALTDGDPWDLYAEPGQHWPYPPGFLLWVLAAPEAAAVTALPFDAVIQVPAVLADVALAALAGWILTQRGATPRAVIAAVALLAASPILIGDSSYHGQFDSVATLPALAGAWLWSRPQPAVAPAALLLGLAVLIKSPLALVVVALLPTARSWRQAAMLAGVAAAPALLALAPFLAAEPEATVRAFGYIGLVGLGGLAVVVDPSLPRGWIAPRFRQEGGPLLAIHRELQVAVVSAVLAVGRRARGAPLEVVCLMFLAVWSFTVPWSYTYLVWGLPFLVAAGRLRLAAAVNALALPVVLIRSTAPHGDGLVLAYTAAVIALWAVTAAGTLTLARDALTGRLR